MRQPTPVCTRSITIPYEIMQKLVKYAEVKGISVNKAIIQAVKLLLERATP